MNKGVDMMIVSALGELYREEREGALMDAMGVEGRVRLRFEGRERRVVVCRAMTWDGLVRVAQTSVTLRPRTPGEA